MAGDGDTLARFRAEHTRRIGDPDFAALVAVLERTSPDFPDWWPRHEVLAEQLGTKTVAHRVSTGAGCTAYSRCRRATRTCA